MFNQAVFLARRICMIGLLALMSISCGRDFSDGVPDRAIRAAVVADEVVERVVQFYADSSGDGKVRTYAIDDNLIDQIGDPDIEFEVRRLAERLPSEEDAEWLLRFWGGRKWDYGDLVFSVMMVDVKIEYCCHMVGVTLTEDKEGWSLSHVYDGGFAHETEELRNERAKKAILLP